ncbi:MAG: tetratricopeptide repeat protein [Syntrophobacteria bacterium]
MFFLWLGLLVLLVQPVMAEGEADGLWDFATHLYQKQEYYRAIGEYQRFLFLFPTDSRCSRAQLQIGRCYRQGGKTEKALGVFLDLFGRGADEPVGREALLEIVIIREEQKDYPEAIYWARQFLERYPEDPESDRMWLRLAWFQIERGAYRQALAALERIQVESKSYPRARSLMQGLEQRPERGEKSPRVAGVLSALLPGAGHLYAGYPGRAAASFLLNGAFVGATVAAFAHDSPVLGGILGFFELGWYEGGIRSAATAAREANREQEERYRRELKRRYQLSVGFVPEAGRPAIALRMNF